MWSENPPKAKTPISLDSLIKEGHIPHANPMPDECYQIIEKLKYYTLEEMIALLDYWDLEAGEFEGKHAFMLTLRGQMLLVKKGKRKPKKRTQRMDEKEKGLMSVSYGKTMRHKHRMECVICGKEYWAVFKNRSKYCSRKCQLTGLKRAKAKRLEKENEQANKSSGNDSGPVKKISL